MLREMSPAEIATGRWHGILSALGIPSEFLTNKHGPCPICGGKDRYRFDNKEGRGTWYCNHCGSGDGYSMLEKFHGWPFRKALDEVKRTAGVVEVEKPVEENNEAKKVAALRKVWEESKSISKGDPAWNYLRSRGFRGFIPVMLRFHPSLSYRHDNGTTTRHPAMVAAVTYDDAKVATIHRTYLTAEGKKANVSSPKKLMPGKQLKGVSIKLGHAAETIGVAEGIETALIAGQRFGMPVWSCIASSFLAAFEPPKEAKRIVIFGDNDKSYAGQAAAFSLAQRLQSTGRVEVEVRIPEIVGKDWADQ